MAKPWGVKPVAGNRYQARAKYGLNGEPVAWHYLTRHDTHEEAEQAAQLYAGMAARGIDPAQPKKAKALTHSWDSISQALDARGSGERRESTNTKRAFRYELLKPLLATPPSRLTERDSQKVCDAIRTLTRRDGSLYCPEVRKQLHGAYKALAKHAFEMGLSAPHPLPKCPSYRSEVEEEDRVQILSVAQKAAFLAKFQELSPRYLLMVKIMFGTGIRIGEALGLNVENWNPTANTLTVRNSFTQGVLGPTKTGESRTFSVRASVAQLLNEAMAGKAKGEPMFQQNSGKRIGYRHFIRKDWNPVAEACGLEITTHVCRHQFVSEAMDVMSFAQIKGFTGHKTVRVLEDTYGHLRLDTMQAITAKWDAVEAQAAGQPITPLRLVG